MKKITFTLVCLLLILTAGFYTKNITSVQAATTQVTLDTYQDTYIKKSTPDANYSTSLLLEGSRYKLASDQEQKVAILGFDLSQYPDKIVTDATLKFEVTSLDSSTSDIYGIKSKAIKLYPEIDFTNITYNNFLATKTVRAELTPEQDPTAGQTIPSSNPTLLSYAYPYIHTFIMYPTNGNTSLETQYRARISNTTGANIVEIPLGDALKELGGSRFSIHLNNQRGKDITVYSKENSGRQTPQLILTLEDKPALPDTTNLAISEVQSCTQQGYTLNGLTGLSNWRDTSHNPNFAPEADVYERFYWSQLEVAQDDYSGIATHIGSRIAALQPGQKFAFRIRAMDTVPRVPAYITAHPEGTMNCSNTTVPNWNNEYFVSRSEKLLEAVADYIVANNYQDKISWIEIGFTGKWGETNGACVDTISEPNLERYVNMYSNNFPFARLLSMTDDHRLAAIALAKPANEKGVMGIRRDSLGGDNHRFAETAVNFESFHLLKDRWKVAPYTVEFGGPDINVNASMWDLSLLELEQFNVTSVGNGNTVTGQNNSNPFAYTGMLREQSIFNEIARNAGFELSLKKWGISQELIAGQEANLLTSWLNNGTAPVYEPYKAQLILKNTQTQDVTTYDLTVNLSEILPSKNKITGVVSHSDYLDTLVLPTEGEYTVSLKVIDADQDSLWPRQPLALCNQEQQADQSYLLGTITVNPVQLVATPTPTPEPTPEPTPLPTPTPTPEPFETIKINFEKSNTTTPEGYLKDSGELYGLRNNGETYGWDLENTSGARERKNRRSLDKRYDTFNHMMLDENKEWNLSVPNGEYTVSITAGDPNYYDSVYNIGAEGQLVVSGTPTNGSRFISGTATVTVTDGNLSITNMSGAVNNKISFLEISALEE